MKSKCLSVVSCIRYRVFAEARREANVCPNRENSAGFAARKNQLEVDVRVSDDEPPAG